MYYTLNHYQSQWWNTCRHATKFKETYGFVDTEKFRTVNAHVNLETFFRGGGCHSQCWHVNIIYSFCLLMHVISACTEQRCTCRTRGQTITAEVSMGWLKKVAESFNGQTTRQGLLPQIHHHVQLASPRTKKNIIFIYNSTSSKRKA